MDAGDQWALKMGWFTDSSLNAQITGLLHTNHCMLVTELIHTNHCTLVAGLVHTNHCTQVTGVVHTNPCTLVTGLVCTNHFMLLYSLCLSKNLKVRRLKKVIGVMWHVVLQVWTFVGIQMCEYRLMAFENRVQRRIFGLWGRKCQMEGWSKMCNEDLHDWCSLPDISGVIRQDVWGM
jgi:hypothetical protein